MPPSRLKKTLKRITIVQEKKFRQAMAEGCCVEEAAAFADIDEEQCVWMCRRDPLLTRLVDQEATLDELQRQAKAILNDATNPQSMGLWSKADKLRAAKLVIETVKTVKPELLTQDAVRPKTLAEVAAQSRKERGAPPAPGTEKPQ